MKNRPSQTKQTSHTSDPCEVVGQVVDGLSILRSVYDGGEISYDEEHLETVEAAYLCGVKRARDLCSGIRPPTGNA